MKRALFYILCFLTVTIAVQSVQPIQTDVDDDYDDDDDEEPRETIDDIIVNATENTKEFELFYDEQNALVKLEYDMLFTLQELREGRNKSRVKRTAALRNGVQGGYRWTNKHIPYEIAYGTFTSYQRGQIRAAMADWARYTCVTFGPATSGNRIYFHNGNGCSSRVGMVGGAQPVTLATGCRVKGVIAHEVGHAIGLHHEQTRPDRDNYVRIINWNIPSGLRYNFKRYSWDVIKDLAIPYDYRSIMHYGPRAFSMNGGLTIETLDSRYQNVIGNRHRLSFRDIKTVNMMYNCDSGCKLTDAQCPGEGFVGKDCKCWCPGKPYVLCDSSTSKGGSGSSKTGGSKTGGSKTGGSKTGGSKTGGSKTGGSKTGGTKTGGGVKSGCHDEYSRCAYWARYGQCAQTPSFMLVYCKKSCQVCGTGTGGTSTGSSCVDHHRHCPFWAEANYCESYDYGDYMTTNCPRSCRKCTGTSTTVSRCRDQVSNCPYWARSGYCQSYFYRTQMRSQCPRSCGACTAASSSRDQAACGDSNQFCSYWAKSGECERNARYMLLYCKKSCGVCTSSSSSSSLSSSSSPASHQAMQASCVDSSSLCTGWARTGECYRNPRYMLVQCRRSCKSCGGGSVVTRG